MREKAEPFRMPGQSEETETTHLPEIQNVFRRFIDYFAEGQNDEVP